MRLDQFDNSDFDRGASLFIEGLWRFIEGIFINSWLPGSGWRAALLRLFGASIGEGVTIKPHVRIKFPWKFKLGNHSWIGESVWIDNLAAVTIGNNCCISQGAYLCTGNHRWDAEGFDLDAQPITLEDHCWVAGRAVVGPGVIMGEGAILTLNSVTSVNLSPWHVYAGNPAVMIKKRNRS